MKRLTELRYLASLKGGRLTLPKERMRAELARLEDCEDVELIIRREKRPKTWPQLKVFHGTILEQVQAFYDSTDGVYYSLDRIKADLKEMFLPKEKQYYSDGLTFTLPTSCLFGAGKTQSPCASSPKDSETGG